MKEHESTAPRHVCTVCGKAKSYRSFRRTAGGEYVCTDCARAARERRKQVAKPWYLVAQTITKKYRKKTEIEQD